MTLIRKIDTAYILLAAILTLNVIPAGSASAEESAAEPAGVRRFALLVGANYGGLDRVRLRYAESDSQSVAQVLAKLGGVASADRLLVINPQPADLKRAFEKMDERLKAAKTANQRAEFIFYYSGHSDESGLLLRGKRFSYPEIHKAVNDLSADVRIAILDSCASGAFTRTKGGVRKPPFLIDDSTKISGFAVLTSSSASETAQESDRIGGSFFTHYLVSGLRGAADINSDNKVTLAEAYQYAFNETLSSTEATQKGAQHPNYDFQLAGSGDLILTDLRETSASLELGPDVLGRVFIRDEQGRLVAEVNKPVRQPMLIGVEPGTYQITLHVPDGYRRGTIEVGQGKRTQLNVAQLAKVELEKTTARGDLEVAEQIEYQDKFFSFSVVPGLDTNPGGEIPVRNNISFNMLAGMGGALNGFELSGIGAIRSGQARGFQLAGIFNAADSFCGLQIGGIANIYAGGPSTGVSFSGVAEISAGAIKGLQLSGVVAIAQSVYGAQGSIVSVTWDDFHGAQMGVLNYADDMSGAQLGVVNVAAGEVRGAQLGVVNWASKTDGLMFGVVNIASQGADSVPIGLINIIPDGMLKPTAWMSDTSLTNVAIKMGSRKFYTILGAGFQPSGEQKGFSWMVGLGGHLELTEPLWLDIDLVASSLYEDYEFDEKGVDILSKLRVTLGWQIADYFALYGGVSLNFLVSDKREHAGPAWLRLMHTTYDEYNLDLGLGLIAGVQF
jgi:caspase domain-containing protein